MLIDLIRVPEPDCIDDLLDEPLGLLYLGSALKCAGYDVRITNLAGCSYEGWKPRIKEADLYGIQLYTPTVNLGVEIAKFIKTNFPGKPVICGGAHPTALPNSSDLSVFDNVIVGEGEVSIVKTADSYQYGNKMSRIIKSEFIEDLDSISFPDRSLVNMNMFHRKVFGQRCFGIIGSRGCCYKCAFCDRSLFGERLRIRSVDNIIDEIKDSMSKYKIRHFEFFDNIFLPDMNNLRDFRDKAKELDIIYRCNIRADILSSERCRVLYDSGCRVLCFGLESGSQRILDAMKKDVKVEENLNAISMAKEEGLTTIGYFIIGFPGETKETIEKTIEFIKNSEIDQAQFYTFVPFPGCEVYNNPEMFGAKIITDDFSKYFIVAGRDGRGGKIVDTQHLTADELQKELVKIRQFLKNRGSRGPLQDFHYQD